MEPITPPPPPLYPESSPTDQLPSSTRFAPPVSPPALRRLVWGVTAVTMDAVPPPEWTVEDVTLWLQFSGLSQYVATVTGS